MARPIPVDIESTGEGWDAFVDANFDICFVTPFPFATFVNFASLPAANSYDQCVAAVVAENRLAFSDGTNWHMIPIRGTAIVNLTDNSTGVSGGNVIAVVTSVATAADAIATLAAKLNSLMSILRIAQAVQ